MKITISKESLLDIIGPLQSILDRRSTDPKFASILFDASESGMVCSATNGEISSIRFVGCDVKEHGQLLLPGASLFGLVKEFPDSKITIESKANNWAQISFGKSKFTLAGIDPSSFVEIKKPNIELAFVDSEVLRSMIDKTIGFTSTDETRYHLQGVMFESEVGILRAIATDGHRLAKVEKSIESSPFPGQVIVPRRGLLEVKKFCESNLSVGVGFCDNQMIVSDGNNFVMIRLIEGKFPNYQALIKPFKKTFSIEKNKITACSRRLANVISKRSKTIVISLEDGSIEFSGNDQETGEGKETYESDYSGDKLKIGVNGEYLSDYLSCCDGDIEASITNSMSPIMFRDQKDNGHLCVIMPIKI
jgi:DNA polymerase-3 subunit beta